ncbi:MAG: preprotein translocase subunit SecG [bacterium]|nr:preprotein translocase subunit SecG [bacterium]
MNRNIIYIVQIVLGIMLVVLILLQAKGTGLGSTFGGEIAFYRTRRGLEKMLFYLTIGLSGLFLIISVLGLL